MQSLNNSRIENRLVAIAARFTFAAYSAVILCRQVMTWGQRQWDFKTFYYASKAYQAGLSPYDLSSLTKTAGHTISYQYVYPPLSLYLFWPFTTLGYESAHFTFLAVKCLLLVYLLSLWARKFLPGAGGPLFLIFSVLAFNRALQVDVWTGNVSTLEQCLIWTGLCFFLRGKLGWFCAMICLAASWKLLPAAFLILALFSENRRKWVYFGVSAVSIIGVQALSAMRMPGLFMSFLKNATGLDERGVTNPSTLAFVRDVFDKIGLSGHSTWSAVAYGVILLLVIAVTVTAFGKTRKWGRSDRQKLLVMLFCVVYALAAPRLKDYSYMLLIPVSYWVISRPVFRRRFWLLFVVAILPYAFLARFSWLPELLTGYCSLLLAFLVWGLYLSYAGKPLAGGTRSADAGVVSTRETAAT